MSKNKINALVKLLRILEKEKDQELKSKLARWYDENRHIDDIWSWLKLTFETFGIDESNKLELHKFLSVHLLQLYRAEPVEVESLAQIWSKSGKGVLVRSTKTGEPFTLSSEFNDGSSVRYILKRTDTTSMLAEGDTPSWSVIF
jgi:hypothetical protein